MKRYQLSGTDGNDKIIYNAFSAYRIDLGAGDDFFLDSTETSSVIIGGLGNDLLFTNAGDDFLFGGQGDDTIHVTFDEDTPTHVRVRGGDGSDRLIVEYDGDYHIDHNPAFHTYEFDNGSTLIIKNIETEVFI